MKIQSLKLSYIILASITNCDSIFFRLSYTQQSSYKLVNEFKILCKHNNINIHDVITAASTKPFGYNPFEPGPGVGGHCIPIDPLFVSWYAKNNGLSADFIELARKKNIEITNWVVRKIFKIIRDLKFKKVKSNFVREIVKKKIDFGILYLQQLS